MLILSGVLVLLNKRLRYVYEDSSLLRKIMIEGDVAKKQDL